MSQIVSSSCYVAFMKMCQCIVFVLLLNWCYIMSSSLINTWVHCMCVTSRCLSADCEWTLLPLICQSDCTHSDTLSLVSKVIHHHCHPLHVICLGDHHGHVYFLNNCKPKSKLLSHSNSNRPLHSPILN